MSKDLTLGPNFESTRLDQRRFKQRYVWLALTPFILLLLMLGYQSVRQWRADQAIDRQIAQWDEAGVPYDDASMHAYYLEKTFPEGHADWARVIRLTDWGARTNSYSKLPYVGHDGEPPEVLIPSDTNDQWTDDALVAGYLDEMRPVIDLVEQASDHPTPVRFPMHFQGFNTLLPHIQSSRAIVRILSLDCDYAYSHNDTPRAMRDLTLMQSTIEAFDSRDFLLVTLVTNAVQGMRLESIRRTLTHCVWDERELTALRDSISVDQDIAAPFRAAIWAERALALTSIRGSMSTEEIFHLIGKGNRFVNQTVQPTDLLLLIDYYNEIIATASDSVTQWKKQAEALERRLNEEDPNSIAYTLLPATTQCIGTAINLENTRRWTLTAIALRQYHQQQDRWPKQLSELKTVGLEFQDYSNIRGEMFGYEVDGDAVYLWKSERDDEETTISETRPTQNEEEQEDALRRSLESYLLELHAP